MHGGGDYYQAEAVSAVTTETQQTKSVSLKIPDVIASLNAMNDSLYYRVEKFYSVNTTTAYKTPKQQAAMLADLVEWLDKIWLNGDLEERMTYEEYLEFRDSIKNPPHQVIAPEE